MRIFWPLLLTLLVTSLSSCLFDDDKPKEDMLLAKVHNKTLYLSELEGMFPEGTTGKDSSLIISAFIERWVRETLLLNEAEQNIPSDLNIDKLVRDYRASLIKHNYEQILEERLLDSVITQQELAEFYTAHKEQYQLEDPILRCYLIKEPLDAPNADQLPKWWKSNNPRDFAEMVQHCNRYAAVHLLEDSVWYDFNKIAIQLPPGVLRAENASANRNLTMRDDRFQYYFKLLEWRSRKDPAPLSYAADQIRKLILYRRKLKLLEDTKDELYQREMRRNNIQIFTQ